MSAPQPLDFGGAHRVAGAMQETTLPLARGMVVIRPASPPFEGLFLQLCIPPRHAARLRAHPLLAALAPDARFVGAAA